jgi:hypothetical protein
MFILIKPKDQDKPHKIRRFTFEVKFEVTRDPPTLKPTSSAKIGKPD